VTAPVPSPVPYESRVRPLIAAASQVPWCFVPGDRYLVVEDANTLFVAGSVEPRNVALLSTAVNTAAASADLAEAVRAYGDCLKGAFVPATAALRRDAMLAALARLDSAASSGAATDPAGRGLDAPGGGA
jgi:hypothetical protein